MALALESIQIIHHFAAEERAAIFECRFIDDDLRTFGLDAFHHTLNARLAEVVRVRFHRQAVHADDTLPLLGFLREAKDSGVFALYYIDLTTGLRRGELLGLKWSDIDLEKGDLRVQRQIGRIDGKIIEMPLKTKNAYRTLPLSTDAIDVLMQQRRKTGNSEWVFPSPTGGMIISYSRTFFFNFP